MGNTKKRLNHTRLIMVKRKRDENFEPNIRNLKKLKIGDIITTNLYNDDEIENEIQIENQPTQDEQHVIPGVSQRVQQDGKGTKIVRKTIKRSIRTKKAKNLSEPFIKIPTSPTKSTVSYKLQFHQTTLNPDTLPPPDSPSTLESTPKEKPKKPKRIFRCRRCGAEGCAKNMKKCPGKGLKKKEWLVGWVVEHLPLNAANLQSIHSFKQSRILAFFTPMVLFCRMGGFFCHMEVYFAIW